MSSPELAGLLLHPLTRKHFKLFLNRPSHALLITGKEGSGKSTLAHHLSSVLLDTEVEQLTLSPYFTLVDIPEGKTEIPIEVIRTIVNGSKLKIPGKAQVKRVVVIRRAEAMSPEAQNALLKVLEEPPPGNVFILCSPSPQSILPTIVSRSRILPVHDISLGSTADYYGESYNDQLIKSAWSLSAGSAGLLNALLRDDTDHPLKEAVIAAKELLKHDTYSRLLKFDELAKDRARFKLEAEALGRVMEALHHQAVAGGSNKTSRLLKNRRLIKQSQELLETNTSTRLIALRLALTLKL